MSLFATAYTSCGRRNFDFIRTVPTNYSCAVYDYRGKEYTSNSNPRLKSAVDKPMCVLKRGGLCVAARLHVKMRPDSCTNTR